MSRRVISIREKTLIRRSFFSVVEAHIRHDRYDGSQSDELVRISFERGDSAAALLHDPSANTIVLVEQFRYPTYKNGPGWMYELPAGSIDTNHSSDPDITIRHELLEEAGYRISVLDLALMFYTSPGASSERLFLYYGTVTPTDKVAIGGGLASEGEDVRTVVMNLDEAMGKVALGEIIDAKTIIGLQWLKLRSLQC